MLLRITIFFYLLILSSSCNLLTNNSPIETSSDEVNLIQRGDIIVSNINTDSIVLLDSEGNFKETLYDSPADTALLLTGLHWDRVNKEVLFVYDHTTNAKDVVKAFNVYDGSVRDVLTNNQVQGVLPALARLPGGDILIVETASTSEKFSSNGVRQGAPFINTLTATVVDIAPLMTGGFMVCSSGTANTVRIYNLAGALQATATSANPIPSLGALTSTSCVQDQNSGVIYVSYSGATDAVRAYNASLSSILWTFTDTNVLTTPGRISLRPNGNVLVTDTGFHHIVEIDTNGAFVQTMGGTVLNNPGHITVVK